MNNNDILNKYNDILNKYIDLIDKGYCSDCNELNCIDNFPHAKITHAIRELQQENRKQKEIIDKAIDFIKNGDLLYLANKNSIVYRNNIEIRAVVDRLNDLLQILEDKVVSV